MRQNDLASVNPALLNDEDVGFYDKAIESHDKLYKAYEKDDAIKTGINDRLEAANQFKIDKDFEALFGKIKITAKEDLVKALDQINTANEEIKAHFQNNQLKVRIQEAEQILLNLK